jgi:hypothetical protein
LLLCMRATSVSVVMCRVKCCSSIEINITFTRILVCYLSHSKTIFSFLPPPHVHDDLVAKVHMCHSELQLYYSYDTQN